MVDSFEYIQSHEYKECLTKKGEITFVSIREHEYEAKWKQNSDYLEFSLTSVFFFSSKVSRILKKRKKIEIHLNHPSKL